MRFALCSWARDFLRGRVAEHLLVVSGDAEREAADSIASHPCLVEGYQHMEAIVICGIWFLEICASETLSL